MTLAEQWNDHWSQCQARPAVRRCINPQGLLHLHPTRNDNHIDECPLKESPVQEAGALRRESSAVLSNAMTLLEPPNGKARRKGPKHVAHDHPL